MESYQRPIQHIVKLHQDAENYYRRCAFITTEPDLKELFERMAQQRQRLSDNLLATLETGFKKGIVHFSQVQLHYAASYFQGMWYSIKIALILNDRTRLLGYCTKAEANIWREYQRAVHSENLPDDLFRILTVQQQEIYQMLEAIKDMPIEKYYLQKRVAA